MHNFLSYPEYYFDFPELVWGLREPDHEHHATSENQIFTGVNGDVDHFIFDTDIDGGDYIVNNYEPGLDWLIFVSGRNDSIEVTAIESDVMYTNNNASAHGHVHVNPAGGVLGTSIAIITESSMFI
jgi:hypothetical protein